MSKKHELSADEVRRKILVQISAGKLSSSISHKLEPLKARPSFSDKIGLIIPAIIATIGTIFLITN